MKAFSFLSLLVIILVLMVACGGSGPKPAPERIAFISERDGWFELYVSDTDGAGLTRLTHSSEDSMIYEFAWSPDGSKIAFMTWSDELRVIGADGSDQTLLSGQVSGQIAWSTDGNKVAFGSTKDGNSGIFAIDADGSNETLLSSETRFLLFPQWSPDGARIAFLSDRDGDYAFELLMINANGSSARQLANTCGSVAEFKWSPDGTKIVFACADSEGYNQEMYVVDADGANERLLGSTVGGLTWSPDSTQIFFVIFTDGEQLYTLDLDESSPSQLTNEVRGVSYFSLSPDGTKIAYYTENEQIVDEIYVMDAVGTNRTLVATKPGRSGGHLDWSSDSKKIAFDAEVEDDGPMEIYVVGADGSGLINLSNNPESDEGPRWSPVKSP